MRKPLNVLIVSFILATLATTAAFAADDAAAEVSRGPVININTADVAQLTLLPRIGEKVAQRIVDYRTENGPFESATDLMQVKGIGEKSFEMLRPYLVLEGETTLQVKQKAPRTRPSGSPARAAQ